MEKFVKFTGKCAPLMRANIDTDQIIPKQFLKSVGRSGFGQYLFYDWRFQPDGRPNSDFILNQPEFSDASVLIAGENFGCGSSREHAPWSLYDYGFRVIIAPSFADIFYNNCFKTGLLPIRLPSEIVATFASAAMQENGFFLTVDLPNQTISAGSLSQQFEIEPFYKRCLIQGLDEIGMTLVEEAAISDYEARFHLQFPFLKF
jgi:3-isopropylmalate/(R)-2-methylmalate dehydratase small subunit